MVADGADVTFTTVSLASAGVVLIAGTNIQIVYPGDYELHFYVNVQEANQFAVAVNGAVLGGSVYGQNTVNCANPGRLILTIPEGAMLNLRNKTGFDVALLEPGSGPLPSVTASFMINKLKDA